MNQELMQDILVSHIINIISVHVIADKTHFVD